MWSSKVWSMSSRTSLTKSAISCACSLLSAGVILYLTSLSTCSVAYITAPIVASLSRISRYFLIALRPFSSLCHSSARKSPKWVWRPPIPRVFFAVGSERDMDYLSLRDSFVAETSVSLGLAKPLSIKSVIAQTIASYRSGDLCFPIGSKVVICVSSSVRE